MNPDTFSVWAIMVIQLSCIKENYLITHPRLTI